jgi:hypothetical protein
MCTRSGESIDYRLLYCDVARELWFVLFCLFSGEWVIPRKVASLRGHVGSRNILEVWRMTHLYLIWCLWGEQNTRSFEVCMGTRVAPLYSF